jgi:prepilin signal peptidase PulO-like enzyme (type II secretory pathway)
MEILGLFFFVLGGVFASFLNVLVFSSKSLGKNLKKKRSKCDSCKKNLVWWELIPIFSWVILGGKCSRCKADIPVYNIFSELALAFVFYGLFNMYFDSPVCLAFYFIFVLVTYFLSMYDIEYGVVPNKWVFPITGVAVVLSIVEASIVGPFWEVISDRLFAGIGYSLFFVLMNMCTVYGLMPGVEKGKQGFGWGDAKLAVFLGVVLGVVNTVISAWVAVFCGAAVGLILLIQKKDKNLRIPFIPFMTFGAWITLFWGDEIIDIVRRIYLY